MKMKKNRWIWGAVPAATVAGGLATAAWMGLATHPLAAQEQIKVSAAEQSTAISLENAFASVAEAVRPATVFITAQSEAAPAPTSNPNTDAEDGGFEEFFRGFGNRQNMPRTRRASGSGVIVRPEGYILTNDHVVSAAGPNAKVTVYLEGNRKYVGTVYRDPRTDLAVVKINAPKPLPYVSIADSNAIRVGQWAIAIGSPFGQQSTVTSGIVSALHRKSSIGFGEDGKYYPNLIQTDASINPGNSGGPPSEHQGRTRRHQRRHLLAVGHERGDWFRHSVQHGAICDEPTHPKWEGDARILGFDAGRSAHTICRIGITSPRARALPWWTVTRPRTRPDCVKTTL